MEPRGSMLHSQGLSDNPQSRINQIPRTDTYFFKIYSTRNFVLPLSLGLPKVLFPARVPVKILEALLLSAIPPMEYYRHLILFVKIKRKVFKQRKSC